jgi:hypothetical protein
MTEDDEEPHSPRGALAALLVVVVLVVAVVFVGYRLRESGRMQDCIASGRTNCAPIEGQPAGH